MALADFAGSNVGKPLDSQEVPETPEIKTLHLDRLEIRFELKPEGLIMYQMTLFHEACGSQGALDDLLYAIRLCKIVVLSDSVGGFGRCLRFSPLEGGGEPPGPCDMHGRGYPGIKHMSCRSAIAGGGIDRRSMPHSNNAVVFNGVSARCVFPGCPRVASIDELSLARSNVRPVDSPPLIDDRMGVRV